MPTKQDNKIEVKMSIKIDEQFIIDMLCDAGIGYWGHYDTSAGKLESWLREMLREEKAENKFVVVEDPQDGEPPTKHFIHRRGIIAALERLPSIAGGRHADSILKEDYDAETGDVVVQLAVLGEITYG
jgi:hypothetical protein